jgi:hypothetical protein
MKTLFFILSTDVYFLALGKITFSTNELNILSNFLNTVSDVVYIRSVKK